MKLFHKIAAAFAFIVFCILVTNVFNYIKLNALAVASDKIEHMVLPNTQAIAKIKYSISSVRRLEAQIVIADSTERFSLSGRLAKLRADSLTLILEMKKEISVHRGDVSDKYVTLLENLEREAKAYFLLNESVANIAVTTPNGTVPETAVKIIFNDTRKPYNAMMKVIDEMDEMSLKFAKAQGLIVDDAHDSAIIIILSGAVVAALVSIFFAWSITRLVVVPVNQASVAAEKIASGDLTADLPHGSRDEIGKLMSSVSHMQRSLITLVSHVKQGSENVAKASSEIAQGNMDLSSRTENQASALEETAASMSELASAVAKNAKTAHEASNLAGTASNLAIKGGTSVDQVVSVMKAIDESSKKIADIISVIDGIAFQTNILALNAAVEAVRAGEQGKGFAVVALEVRNLAGRSAAAAKEIKSLVETSVGNVTNGVKLADSAGNQMAEVVEAIGKLANLVSEISTASNDQSSGVKQVEQAVTQMDQVTQQNAALVEEMAAAASGLNNQANSLVAEVSQFKTA